MGKILLVDDSDNPRRAVSILLKNQGYIVDEADNGIHAINVLKNKKFDIIITDMKMEPVNGIQVLQESKNYSPSTEVIVITAYGTIESSVKAIKLGAFDYITKPFRNDEFLNLVNKAFMKSKITKEVEELQKGYDERSKFDNIIGNSEAMKQVLMLVSQVAKTDSTILITGESGTGKELIAKAIHKNSLRKDKPLITINCGSLPENLLESELFGHMKGSFTGAIKDKKGLFQEADNGTIFLDEIGDILPQTQVKLLRTLQEGEIRRVGDNLSTYVNVRVIAATNKNLEDEIKNNNFRQDLYYRLNVIPIHLPPLRKRKDEIPALTYHFLHKFSNKLNKPVPKLTPTAMSALLSYHWPGNVRELENFIERTVILNNNNSLDPNDIESYFKINNNLLANNSSSNSSTLAELEEQIIMQKLEDCSGNQRMTAELLGISTTTLWRKLKKYQIPLNDIKNLSS